MSKIHDKHGKELKQGDTVKDAKGRIGEVADVRGSIAIVFTDKNGKQRYTFAFRVVSEEIEKV